jgi:hypothetical protein
LIQAKLTISNVIFSQLVLNFEDFLSLDQSELRILNLTMEGVTLNGKNWLNSKNSLSTIDGLSLL